MNKDQESAFWAERSHAELAALVAELQRQRNIAHKASLEKQVEIGAGSRPWRGRFLQKEAATMVTCWSEFLNSELFSSLPEAKVFGREARNLFQLTDGSDFMAPLVKL